MNDQQRAEFEAWESKYIGDPLNNYQVPNRLAYQAALESPAVQALRAALENMLDMYGDSRDCEGRKKNDYEMYAIAAARAALAAMEKQK